MTDQNKPPRAEQRAHAITHHGRTINDPWAWLRDPGYPEVTDKDVLSYLEAENSWFQAAMDPRQPLIDTLFEEMKGRIKEDDASVPQKDGAFVYWRAFEMGAEYRKWFRRPVTAPMDGSADQLILDEPTLAEGKEYFRLGAISISPCGRYLAFAVDDNGSERFEARIRDLDTGDLLPDVIPGTLSSLVWTQDSKALLYGLANDNWRTDNARLHRIGTPLSEDIELFHEEDEGFRVSIGLTSAENWIVLATGDHVTSEVWLVPAADPTAAPRLVSPRLPDREYDLDEHDGWLYIRTNDVHPNFRLVRAKVETPDQWEEIIPASDHFYLTDVSLFKDFYVTEGREDGLDQIELRDYATHTPNRISFPEASYVAGLDDNPEYDSAKLRISYESMVSPETVFDLDLATGIRTTLKVQEIPSGYDAANYASERLTITARDGTPIPVSIVYRKDFPKDGSRPLHLYGYGAYGIAMDPGFSTGRLSLLDRGFAYAIAHIRGGDDLGQQWYLDGKLEKRSNTFTDFVDVAKGLIDLGFSSAGKVTISGGSAGGELMG
ncbi:MAG: prolyl oligopeptidase family serine peptidase, partial [Sphingobium sp.]